MSFAREFTSASDLMAHYRALFARSAPVVPVERVRPAPQPEAAPEPVEQPTPEELLANFSLAFSTEVAPRLSLQTIMEHVSSEFHISIRDIKSERNSLDNVRARQAFYYLARHLTPRSFPQIAKFAGKHDHTTVMKGVKACAQRMDADPDYRIKVAGLRARLETRA